MLVSCLLLPLVLLPLGVKHLLWHAPAATPGPGVRPDKSAHLTNICWTNERHKGTKQCILLGGTSRHRLGKERVRGEEDARSMHSRVKHNSTSGTTQSEQQTRPLLGRTWSNKAWGSLGLTQASPLASSVRNTVTHEGPKLTSPENVTSSLGVI